jgi:hypothetical protein
MLLVEMREELRAPTPQVGVSGLRVAHAGRLGGPREHAVVGAEDEIRKRVHHDLNAGLPAGNAASRFVVLPISDSVRVSDQ